MNLIDCDEMTCLHWRENNECTESKIKLTTYMKGGILECLNYEQAITMEELERIEEARQEFK